MPTRVALFRGINVGGRNRLPMKDLVAVFEAAGCTDVRTCIQSGNVVFRHARADRPAQEQNIQAEFSRRCGFAPDVLFLAPGDIASAIAENPFPDAVHDPGKLHLWFMRDRPTAPDLDRMRALGISTEAFALAGRVFYLHAPAGIGRSRLAAAAERLLGVSATARNWRTVLRVAELAGLDIP